MPSEEKTKRAVWDLKRAFAARHSRLVYRVFFWAKRSISILKGNKKNLWRVNYIAIDNSCQWKDFFYGLVKFLNVLRDMIVLAV